MVISQIFYQIINLCILNIAQFVWLQFMSRAIGKKCSFNSDARMEGMWIYYTMSEKWTFIFRRFSEKVMAPHSSTLAWKIPWTEESGRLQSMGSLRVGHDWATFTFTFHFNALEKEMATHSSVLAWRIPGTEEPSGLLSMGSHRVGHDWSNLAAAATQVSKVINLK